MREFVEPSGRDSPLEDSRRVILAGGGSDADTSNVAAELRDLVDRLAPEAAHAYVSIEPTFESVVTDTQLSDDETYDDERLYRPRYSVN